jgi:hypothetical protein
VGIAQGQVVRESRRDIGLEMSRVEQVTEAKGRRASVSMLSWIRFGGTATYAHLMP